MQTVGIAVVVVLAVFSSMASSAATATGRQFIAEDITGNYTIFIKQGACSDNVSLTSHYMLIPGVYTVPHADILEDGDTCDSDGSFTILTRESIIDSGNGFVLETPPLNKVVTALNAQNATFMVGFEQVDRTCGSSGTAQNSIMVFVEEEKDIDIPGLVNLYPGAKYMIVYEPTSPTPCTYFSKFTDRTIGVPINADDGIGSTSPAAASTATASPLADSIVTVSGASGVTGSSVMPAMTPVSAAEAAEAPGSDVDPTWSPEAEAFDSASVLDDDGIARPEPSSDSVQGSSEIIPTSGPLAIDDGDEDDDVYSTDASYSPKPSEEPEEDGSACFPGDATVELRDGSTVRMDHLQIGSQVKVAPGVYSAVYMFSHKTADVWYRFVQIRTASGHVIRLTGGHYLYVNDELIAARGVHVDDRVSVDGKRDVVVAVDRVMGKGLFNPHTEIGDVVVNGVRAACYTTAVRSCTAHSLLLPVRAMFRATGVTTRWLDNGAGALAKMLPSGEVLA